MRRLPVEPDLLKVPVFKNIVYALRLVWQCDKKLPIACLINSLAVDVFSRFVQSILFLKVLLGVLDRGESYSSYVGTLFAFLLLSVSLLGIAGLQVILKALLQRMF